MNLTVAWIALWIHLCRLRLLGIVRLPLQVTCALGHSLQTHSSGLLLRILMKFRLVVGMRMSVALCCRWVAPYWPRSPWPSTYITHCRMMLRLLRHGIHGLVLVLGLGAVGLLWRGRPPAGPAVEHRPVGCRRTAPRPTERRQLLQRALLLYTWLTVRCLIALV